MFESKQKSDLNKVEEQIVSKKKEIELLKSMLTKTNIKEKKKQKIRELEREADALKHNKIYTFDLIPKDWCADSALTLAYPDITTLLNLQH